MGTWNWMGINIWILLHFPDLMLEFGHGLTKSRENLKASK
jgi:hypothetical protein